MAVIARHVAPDNAPHEAGALKMRLGLMHFATVRRLSTAPTIRRPASVMMVKNVAWPRPTPRVGAGRLGKPVIRCDIREPGCHCCSGRAAPFQVLAGTHKIENNYMK